jgi:hypothetical protein
VAPAGAGLRAEIGVALERHGVPLTGLSTVASPDELSRPLPLRCDLREGDYGPAQPATLAATGPRGRRL